jgi:hypothetical protein
MKSYVYLVVSVAVATTAVIGAANLRSYDATGTVNRAIDSASSGVNEWFTSASIKAIDLSSDNRIESSQLADYQETFGLNATGFLVEKLFNAGSECVGSYESYMFKIGSCIRQGNMSIMYSQYMNLSSSSFSVTYAKYDDNMCERMAPGYPNVWSADNKCQVGTSMFYFAESIPEARESIFQKVYNTQEDCENPSSDTISYVKATPVSTCILLNGGTGSLMLTDHTGILTHILYLHNLTPQPI